MKVDFDLVEDAPLSRVEISECDDIAILLEWREDLELTIVEMKAFRDAWLEAGIAYDEERTRRWAGKLAFTKMGISWIDRQIVRLGGFPPGDHRKQIITRLEGKVVAQRAELAKLKAANCDSDGTAPAADCGDNPVPQDCQARAESIAQGLAA